MEMPYFNPALDRQPMYGSEEHEHAQADVIELLSSDTLAHEVAAGNVTVAMIRPSLENATLEDWQDNAAADTIEQHIMHLGVITKFSVQFDREAIEQFYGGTPKEVQLGLPPERFPEYANRWDEFVDLMASAPTTVLLLHAPTGDAIALWRSQVGHYDILNRRDETTLRGRFGKDNYNNLVHGSDSTESVQREVNILKELLKRNR